MYVSLVWVTAKWSLQFSLQLPVRVKPVVKILTSVVKTLVLLTSTTPGKVTGYSNLRTEDEECEVIPNWC